MDGCIRRRASAFRRRGLTLALTLPALLSAPDDVARMSAAMFTISYIEGLMVSVIGGAAWDLAGAPRFAFLPIAVVACRCCCSLLTIRFNQPHERTSDR